MIKHALFLSFLSLALAACGDDDRPRMMVDAGPTDGGGTDGGPLPDDGGPMDAGNMDAGDMDAGDVDAGTDAGTDAGPTPSDTIAEARAAADGAVSIAISGVFVTYVKPAVGSDPAGFFVQADAAGPALFVAVDPETLTPVPAVGDEVSFTITEMATVDDQRRATMITDLMVLTSGNDLTGLVQDISAETDVVSAVGDYESELVTVTATVASTFGFGGTDHTSADIDTTGITGSTDYELRLTNEVADLLGLHMGCQVTVSMTPLWRYMLKPQVSVWDASEVTAATCNPPVVVSATSLAADTVRVTFDRAIDPASVLADGSQFTFDGGLTASAATASGTDVTITTSAQAPGTTYTVTVAATVLDIFGAGVDASANTATFTGYIDAMVPSAAGQLVITEIMQNPSALSDATGEWFEVHNPSTTVTYNLRDCVVSDLGVDSFTIRMNVYLFPGGYATFANNAAPGFTPSYVYSGTSLGNSDDEVIITCGATEIDRVAYAGAAPWPDPTGASMSLSPAALDATSNDTGTNWCEATTAYGSGDLGTPGSANDACP